MADQTAEHVYRKLARHLAALGMGYPERDELLDILKESFTPAEAEIVLAIPTRVIPLEPAPVSTIAAHAKRGREETENVLSNLAARGLLFSRRLENGETGYSLQQFGHGFPQTFFWGGVDQPNAKRMAELVAKYAGKKDVTEEAYGRTETKPFRYVPATLSLDPESHAVFPFEMMEELLMKVKRIAVAHCPCRVSMELIGRRKCSHALEVCIKYDDLADYVIERGLGREITREEALEILKKCEEAGLVHMVDNAREGIRHTCNCCGCCCWSVGTIRRRKIPRDILMATYFLRETDEDKCTGCGLCADICPVEAIKMEDGLPEIDKEWCIGCGVCAVPCPVSAVKLVRKTDAVPPKDFKELHNQILRQRKFSCRDIDVKH